MTGITDGLSVLFYMAIGGLILLLAGLGYGGYKIYDHYYNDIVVESETEIKPSYILITDGKTIDTTYIYTFKK